MNGVTEIERSPLLEWLPTLCFYNVKGLEQVNDINVDESQHGLGSLFNFVVVCMILLGFAIAFLGNII